MSDKSDWAVDYRPQSTFGFEAEEMNKRYPPRRKISGWKEGEDYFTLTQKFGRPHGPFDSERQLNYDANLFGRSS